MREQAEGFIAQRFDKYQIGKVCVCMCTSNVCVHAKYECTVKVEAAQHKRAVMLCVFVCQTKELYVQGGCLCVCVYNTTVLSEKVSVCVYLCTTKSLYLRSGSLQHGSVYSVYSGVFLVCVCVVFLVISRPAVLSFPVISIQPVFVSGSLGALLSVSAAATTFFFR